ncbi:hypothetical protein TNCV_659031 [Trichonephila clavipes]|nr:hypothetical protein TNCV_659031 [Trichonephila clavipes]
MTVASLINLTLSKRGGSRRVDSESITGSPTGDMPIYWFLNDCFLHSAVRLKFIRCIAKEVWDFSEVCSSLELFKKEHYGHNYF